MLRPTLYGLISPVMAYFPLTPSRSAISMKPLFLDLQNWFLRYFFSGNAYRPSPMSRLHCASCWFSALILSVHQTSLVHLWFFPFKQRIAKVVQQLSGINCIRRPRTCRWPTQRRVFRWRTFWTSLTQTMRKDLSLALRRIRRARSRLKHLECWCKAR